MTELRQRRSRVRDEGFLAFIRTLPCYACGAMGRTQAAHIRMASQERGKPSTGLQEKPDDRWTVPLCGPLLGIDMGCHARQHAVNEAKFWDHLERDPFVIAERLYGRYLAKRPKTTRGRTSDGKRQRTTVHPKGYGKRSAVQRKAKIQSRGFDKTKRKQFNGTMKKRT